ncbi:MAG: helix-turn-helix transcriptional regulator [Myxococcota bacterium]
MGHSTSATLLAMVRAEVEARTGEPASARSKRALLDLLTRPDEAFDVGRAIRGRADHPVLSTVTNAPTAASVLARWQSIEAFGHTKHRTRTLGIADGTLEVEHVCVDGEPIAEAEHQFVWGLLAGLLERWGSPRVEVSSPQRATTTLSWAPRAATLPSQWVESAHVRDAVARILETDVARSWTVAEVAARLGTSPRSLQRSLRSDGSTFSERLQRARLDVAMSLLRADRLSLTEIAFCSGFADQAHFSRVCRKRFDVPPTALKALLDAEA